jgi:hypothetical protein
VKKLISGGGKQVVFLHNLFKPKTTMEHAISTVPLYVEGNKKSIEQADLKFAALR